nr:methyl-accepting chemotaxis protein [Bradyrhizobium sp. CCBAU 43298]
MVNRTDETVESVEVVSSATAELSASIASISLHANETAQFAAAANRTCQQTNAAINTLDSRIRSIGDILSLIHKIAAQTDLLALNATIEASRAGNLGKGFGVVASEVKELAKQTAAAIEAIKQQTDGIQEAAKRAIEKMQSVSDLTQHTEESVGAIATAVEQQSATTRVIAERATAAVNATRSVTKSLANVAAHTADAGRTTGEVLSDGLALDKLFASLNGQIDAFIQTLTEDRPNAVDSLEWPR